MTDDQLYDIYLGGTAGPATVGTAIDAMKRGLREVYEAGARSAVPEARPHTTGERLDACVKWTLSAVEDICRDAMANAQNVYNEAKADKDFGASCVAEGFKEAHRRLLIDLAEMKNSTRYAALPDAPVSPLGRKSDG